MTEEIFPGTVVQVEDDGPARRLPWQFSDTTYGETGSGRTRIRQRVHPPAFVQPETIVRRSERARAEALAQTFVKQLEQMRTELGRPPEPADLSEQWLRAFGLELWRAGDPVTTEDMRKVAELYLEAVKKGANTFAPGPVK
jgi:hypothetical protein